MRVYKLRDFARRAAKAGVSDADLREAVQRAERGQIDGRIGKFLIKQRIARENQDRAKGFRTIIVYKVGNMAVFMHVFPKNRQANLTDKEEQTYRLAAKTVAGLRDGFITALVRDGEWIEVDDDHDQQELPE